MRRSMISLLVLALMYPLFAHGGEALPAERNIYQEGAMLYVWAAKGLNLRQQPLPSAPVVQKLPYGTPVIVLKQTEPPVPYPLEYFPQKETGDTLTQIADEQPKVVLDGHWLRIRTAEQEGYVFDKLLLELAPMKKDEEISDYLVRVFELTNHRRQKKQHKDTGCDGGNYTTVQHRFTSKKNKVVLETDESDGDACTSGTGGKISIPGFAFGKSFVFFNAVLPALADHGFKYQADQSYEYLLDEIGNTAELKKTKDGVTFQWYYGMN